MDEKRSRPAGVVSRTVRRIEETTQKLRALQLQNLRDPNEAAARRAPEAPKPQVGENVSGRVRHDARGSAVWDLAITSGVFALESTAKLLKKLDAPELKLTDDEPLSLDDSKSGGYDPYNRRR
jgi:hypothetical protein